MLDDKLLFHFPARSNMQRRRTKVKQPILACFFFKMKRTSSLGICPGNHINLIGILSFFAEWNQKWKYNAFFSKKETENFRRPKEGEYRDLCTVNNKIFFWL
jgi:hypothetical protein